jgi:hypothetical protein
MNRRAVLGLLLFLLVPLLLAQNQPLTSRDFNLEITSLDAAVPDCEGLTTQKEMNECLASGGVGGGGSGDITQVGDCTTGACFTPGGLGTNLSSAGDFEIDTDSDANSSSDRFLVRSDGSNILLNMRFALTSLYTSTLDLVNGSGASDTRLRLWDDNGPDSDADAVLIVQDDESDNSQLFLQMEEGSTKYTALEIDYQHGGAESFVKWGDNARLDRFTVDLPTTAGDFECTSTGCTIDSLAIMTSGGVTLPVLGSGSLVPDIRDVADIGIYLDLDGDAVADDGERRMEHWPVVYLDDYCADPTACTGVELQTATDAAIALEGATLELGARKITMLTDAWKIGHIGTNSDTGNKTDRSLRIRGASFGKFTGSGEGGDISTCGTIIETCEDFYDTGGPPQTSGTPDSLCDFDGSTAILDARGLVEINEFQHLALQDVCLDLNNNTDTLTGIYVGGRRYGDSLAIQSETCGIDQRGDVRVAYNASTTGTCDSSGGANAYCKCNGSSWVSVNTQPIKWVELKGLAIGDFAPNVATSVGIDIDVDFVSPEHFELNKIYIDQDSGNGYDSPYVGVSFIRTDEFYINHSFIEGSGWDDSDPFPCAGSVPCQSRGVWGKSGEVQIMNSSITVGSSTADNVAIDLQIAQDDSLADDCLLESGANCAQLDNELENFAVISTLTEMNGGTALRVCPTNELGDGACVDDPNLVITGAIIGNTFNTTAPDDAIDVRTRGAISIKGNLLGKRGGTGDVGISLQGVTGGQLDVDVAGGWNANSALTTSIGSNAVVAGPIPDGDYLLYGDDVVKIQGSTSTTLETPHLHVSNEGTGDVRQSFYAGDGVDATADVVVIVDDDANDDSSLIVQMEENSTKSNALEVNYHHDAGTENFAKWGNDQDLDRWEVDLPSTPGDLECTTAGCTINDEPISTPTESSPMDLCRRGDVKGGALVDGTLRSWTCGNYNWSAEVGGVTASQPDYNTATTTGGNSWTLLCTGDGTASNGTDSDPYPCLYNGEQIKMYSSADLMLAADNVVHGGKIYMPAGLYHFAGCGRDASGTANDCPVLQHWPAAYHRRVQMWGGREVIGEQLDNDGPLEGGRSGTWFIDDHGNNLDGAGTICGAGVRCDLDNDGSGAYFDHWSFRSGTKINSFDLCDRDTSNDDCVPRTETVEKGQWIPTTDWAWFDISLVGDTEFTGNAAGAATLCIDNSLTTTGTCSGDRRVRCTTNSGGRLGTRTGDCVDFTAGSLGTCEGAADAIATDLAAMESQGQEEGIHLLVTLDQIGDPYDDSSNGSGNVGFIGSVQDAPGTSCGTGGELIELQAMDEAEGVWPFGFSHAGDTDFSPALVAVIDMDRWNNIGGGYRRINTMPSNWLGRDLDNDGGLDAWDCLDMNTDDECDSMDTWALGSGHGGHVRDTTSWYWAGGAGVTDSGAYSHWDGDFPGVGAQFADNLVTAGQGVLTDGSTWHYTGNHINTWDSQSQAMISIVFTPQTTFERNYLTNLSGSVIFNIQDSTGGVISQNRWDGVYGGIGMFRLEDVVGLAIRDEVISGMKGPVFTLIPRTGSGIGGLTVDNINVRGWNPNNDNGSRATAGIWVTDFNDNSSYDSGALRNISFSNIEFIPHEDESACAIFFGGLSGDDSDSRNGLNRPFDELRNQFRFTDIQIAAARSGGTGTHEMFCLGNYETGYNSPDDGTLLDIWESQHWPTWSGLQVNGTFIADNPFRTVEAADAPTCGANFQGVFSRIDDDDGKTCMDSTFNGTLDGGGSTVNLCVCDGSRWRVAGAQYYTDAFHARFGSSEYSQTDYRLRSASLQVGGATATWGALDDNPTRGHDQDVQFAGPQRHGITVSGEIACTLSKPATGTGDSGDGIEFHGMWCDQSTDTCTESSGISHTQLYSTYNNGDEVRFNATEVAGDTDQSFSLRVSYIDTGTALSGQSFVSCEVPYFVP